jgi:hexokinase
MFIQLMLGTSDELFGFIADCVDSFIKTHPPSSTDKNTKPKLGFTFSFPGI